MVTLLHRHALSLLHEYVITHEHIHVFSPSHSNSMKNIALTTKAPSFTSSPAYCIFFHGCLLYPVFTFILDNPAASSRNPVSQFTILAFTTVAFNMAKLFPSARCHGVFLPTCLDAHILKMSVLLRSSIHVIPSNCM